MSEEEPFDQDDHDHDDHETFGDTEAGPDDDDVETQLARIDPKPEDGS